MNLKKLLVLDVKSAALANGGTDVQTFKNVKKAFKIERIEINSANGKANFNFDNEELFQNAVPNEMVNSLFGENFLNGNLILKPGTTNQVTFQNDSGGTLDYHAALIGYYID